MSLRARPRRPSRLAAVVLAAAVAAAVGTAAELTDVAGRAESATVDLRFQLRHASRPADVAVVAIDDLTFSSLRRQWPFPRSLHGRAIDRLHAAGAREIVYDVQFTEPSQPAEDLALYRAVARAPGVILATTEVDDHGGTNVLGGDRNLARAHARAAASNVIADSNGVVRHFSYSVAGLKTLAVAAAEQALHRPVSRSAFGGAGAWIDYRGPGGTIRTFSFSDLLAGRIPASALRGRIVVVGASAPTLHDVHATPAGRGHTMAGPEVQANAIWTALHGFPLRDAPGWLGLLAVLGLALLPPLLSLRLSLPKVALATTGVLAAYLVGAQLAFQAGLLVAVVYPLGALALSLVGTIVASHLSETYERQRISRYSEVLEAEVAERTEKLRETQLEIIRRLGQAAESRDEETGLHIERIGRLCEAVGLEVGMTPHDAELLRHASAMHDIGKIGIPDRILLKPGRLDPDEWEVMKTHTTIGASILSGSQLALVQLAEEIALTHHERWDGSGYPRELQGEEIPLAGRICAVCDVFDALVSKRPYKNAWSREAALAELERGRGRHFEPRLVDAFLTVIEDLFVELDYRNVVARPSVAAAPSSPAGGFAPGP
jgi:CHASE2 domain-containing sensor protein